MTLTVPLIGSKASLVLSIMAGLFKEIYDLMGYGTPDLKDFLYTVLGGLSGYLVYSLLDYLIKTNS